MAPPDLTVIVLAAGQGKRMRSRRAKVMHEVAGRSMLAHVLAAADSLAPERTIIIAAPDADEVIEAAGHRPVVAQHDRLGTAHAVAQARGYVPASGDVLVLYGDTPLVDGATLARLRAALGESGKADRAAVAVLGMRPAEPGGYGRLIVDSQGTLNRIVEAADASAEEAAVGLCNAGLMALDAARLPELLDAIDNHNAKGEYYLTDAVAAARQRGWACTVAEAPPELALGVNSRRELAAVEAAFQARLREAVLAGGATLVAPETVFLAYDTALGPDTVVEPHVVFGPGVSVGEGALIHGFSHLAGVSLGAGAQVGPYARLRPGTELASGAKIGNFVEAKKARLGAGAKANHLTYLGDCEVGAGANIGAGTITCNYDGFRKARTSIGAQAFIGSNTALVAPVTVGEGAIVGAGSTITRDIGADALAVARASQETRPDGARRLRRRRLAQAGDDGGS